jgi:hypothetical protein
MGISGALTVRPVAGRAGDGRECDLGCAAFASAMAMVPTPALGAAAIEAYWGPIRVCVDERHRGRPGTSTAKAQH